MSYYIFIFCLKSLHLTSDPGGGGQTLWPELLREKPPGPCGHEWLSAQSQEELIVFWVK